MSLNSFWLVQFEENSVTVSLVKLNDNTYSILANGSSINFVPSQEESVLAAVDQSLVSAAQEVSLSPNEEPSQAAFILTPFWVSQDGKIVPSRFKLIESLCKKMKLRPLGFISHDEAIVEDANSQDGFPPSFILINAQPDQFTLSLVYLGKIRERIQKKYTNSLDPKLIEDTLVELNSPSTLPPQIIIFGQPSSSLITVFQEYPWIGKKNIETFLHLPDIKVLPTTEIINIYCRTILSQINPGKTPIRLLPSEDLPSSKPEIINQDKIVPEDLKVQMAIQEIRNQDSVEIQIDEVDPTSFGFNQLKETRSLKIIDLPSPPAPPETVSKIVPPTSIIKHPLPKISFSIKPIFKLNRSVLLVIAFSPFLALIPILLGSAKITLFLTPIKISKELNVLLDSSSKDISVDQKIIPVTKKNIKISANASTKTTGEKIIGEKAKGEIIIFNKLDTSQTIPKGEIVTDLSGKKFEILNQISIASSSSNLDQGVITLGQTKTIVQALEIGPEFNIDKDLKLTFKNFTENSLIAKTQQAFVGGIKNQISAVSQNDKNVLNEKIKTAISNSINEKINQDLANLQGSIRDTIKIKQQKIEFSREVGEEADELTASVDADISILVFDPENTQQVVSSFLEKDKDFIQSVFDPQKITLSFKITKVDDIKTQAIMTISGQLLPLIDVAKIKSDLKGKSLSFAKNYLQKNVNRVYNFTINTNFPFLEFINPLPINPGKINVLTETDNL